MQSAWSLPLFVAAAIAALIVSTRPSARDASASATAPMPPASAAGAVGSPPGAKVPFEVRPYVDPEFDFSLAVPVGWRAVVAAESEAGMAMHEPGYAVGFSSPREHADDVFADYLMVEIMPDRESGLFATDGSRHREVVIDGHEGWRDELILPGGGLGTRPPGPGASEAGTAHRDSVDRETPANLLPVTAASTRSTIEPIDLLVRQATIGGLGYTIGFYAIGEPSRRSLLDDAFETMLRTFRLPHPPFDIS